MRNPGSLLIVLMCLLIAASAGAVRHPAGLMPVTITIKTHDNVYWLAQQGINIEELRGLTAEARLTKTQVDLLTAAGYAVAPRAEAEITKAQLAGYHTYTQVSAFLDSIHTAYPAITKKVSFGTTVQGRSLWAFLITDNPDINENEAEVRLAANIHGDEVVGKELLLALIDSLTKSYGSSAAIADLINNREIWIVPCLNPDGLTLSQRYNANGEDLNRDYPVPDGGSNGGSVSGTETETQQTMSYWGAKHTALSMVFHGGAVVANYPWDYTTTPCPDDAVARAVALGYSKLNAPMYNSAEFTNGITNGAVWYIVRGSLQDWSYNATGGMDITVECSGTKWPSASTLQGYWNDNKNSLLYFIRKAGEGIGGVVTDSTTGLPLNGVTVTVAGTGKAITTDIPGDYHRMLATGAYSLSFAKTGYTSKTISNVSVNFDNLITLNVALKPTGSSTPTLAISTTSWSVAAAGGTSSSVSMTNSGTTSVIAYTVSSSQAWLTVSAASGSTPGSFTMTAAANTTTSSRSATVTVTATTSGVSGSPKTISVSQAGGSSQVTIFSDDMTNLTGWTLSPTTGGWTTTTTRYNSASSSAMGDNVSPYAASQNNYMTRSVNLSGYTSATLTFYAWQYTESGYDYVYAQYLVGTTWTTAWSRAGSYQAWAQQTVTIPVTATQVRFYFKSDGSVQNTGVYIDDVALTATGGSTAPALAVSSTSWAPAAGGGTSIAVNVTNSGSTSVIAYIMASDQSWLTLSASSGNTPGSFTMTAAANTGAARSATVTVTAAGVAGSPKTIVISQAAGSSGGIWTDVSATTQSAHPYINNYNYTWTITGPAGATKMKVYFDSIKTETRYDSVFVLNSAGAVIQSFTGTFRAVWSGEVAGNVVKIKLKTDASVTGFGFRSNKYSCYTTAAAKNELQAIGYPGEYSELLCQNRPNPAANGALISYNLPTPRNVSLTVYNLNGQIVKTLVSGNRSAGHHTIEWDGKDNSGCSVSTGAYIYRLISGDKSAIRRLTVIR